MTLSELSIERPVFATVVNLLVLLVGMTAVSRLPLREYPDVDNPVVSISATYVGASAETVESSLTEPLEQSLNGVDGIRSITSQSQFGGATVTVELQPGRDLDLAANDVSNAVQTVLDRLPDGAERPVIRKASADARPIIWLQASSDSYSDIDLTDITERYIKQPLQILPGVAGILVGGEREYAMRVWLDPDRMAALGVDPAAVRRAILDNNLKLPAGEIEAETRKFTVLADAQIDDPVAFEGIVIRWDGTTPVRIRDVGRVELGSENYNTVTRFDGRPIIAIGVIRQSNANELALTRAVREAIPVIQKTLPDDVALDIALDNTAFVEESLREVVVTLLIAFALVVVVNMIFLRSAMATLIPSIAIPVSLVGTLAVMQVLGFSVNVLTLLAFVLAIGLLVDDAIVVLENAYRRQELGEGREEAARRGSREVYFAVVATTIALVAVLLPLSIMTGGTGRLFREFSITMATSVLFSMLVAVTLVPMMCARFLVVKTEHGRLFTAIEAVLQRLNRGYERALSFSTRHTGLVMLFLLANVLGAVALFLVLPQSLTPIEDRGKILTLVRAPQGSTLSYTRETMLEVERALLQTPAVAHTFAAVGLASGGARTTSNGWVYARLVPWEERSETQQELVRGYFGRFMQIPSALVFPINLPSLGVSSIYDVELVLKSSSAHLDEFDRVSQVILDRAKEIPGLVNADRDLLLESPQINVEFDRDRAADLGVPVSAIAEALQTLLSQSGVSEFVLRNKQYDVITALAPRYRAVPEQIGHIHVRAADGAMVPLSNLVRITATTAPESLNHYDLQRAVRITGNLAPGASLGPVLAQVEAIAEHEMPAGFGTALAGLSREFRESSAEIYFTFAIALLFIYLVLAAQFESFLHPLTILLSVPLALLGALLTLYATGHTINIFSQVGMILLVGLVAKNSILLVDYANRAHEEEGKDLLQAVLEAGKTRFRPILMTSATSILGAVPLMIATGAGAESRRPIGAAVVGGLIFSTAFTLLVIPVLHLVLVGAAERLGLVSVPPRAA